MSFTVPGVPPSTIGKMQATSIVCASCGVEAARTGPVQKYCPLCSEAKDLERKKLWARDHPLTEAQHRRRTQVRKFDKPRATEICNGRNRAEAKSIAWMGEQIDLRWAVRIAVPFDYCLSKNHIYTNTRWGHRALRRDSSNARDQITLLLKEAVQGMEVKRNKVWIDIFVQKPNHRGDAINVIDLVCDGVKLALGIDDRWFSIRRLDWQIIKEKPLIYIGVGQEECEHSKLCSHCGLILPDALFGKSVRECKGCKQARRKRA